MSAAAPSIPAGGGQKDRVAWLAVPAVGYLAIVYALPLVFLLARSVTGPEGFTLSLFVQFFADPYSWRVIWNTLRIALLTTLVCLVIGFPVAIAMARAKGLMQVALLVAIILPLSIGVVVKAFAWQIVLRRDGVVSQFLVGTGIWSEPQRLLFTESGLVLGAANVFLPFMILPIYSVVKLIDPRLSEAGATLGASPFYRFRRIFLPLTLPASSPASPSSSRCRCRCSSSRACSSATASRCWRRSPAGPSSSCATRRWAPPRRWCCW